MALFNENDHQNAGLFLAEKPGNALLVTLRNGVHFGFLALDAFNGARLSGMDEEGSKIVVELAEITAFMLAVDYSGGPSYGLRPIAGSIEEFGVSENLESWQTAFMELRAACDESTDARVKEASARLDRVESEGEQS